MDSEKSEHGWRYSEKDVKDACARKEYDKAETILARALKLAEESGLLETRLVHNLHTLANIHCLERKYAKAEGLYRNVLKVREKILGSNHADIVDSLEKLAVVVRETKGKPEAMAIAFRAQTLAAGLRMQTMTGV